LHFMLTPKIELMAVSNFGYGTTVYQGENRYSLKNILFFQNKIEIRERDKWFLRAYATNEDAGDTYDAVVTAFLMQNALIAQNKPNENDPLRYWNSEYKTIFAKTNGLMPGPSISNRIHGLPGMPNKYTPVSAYDY